MQKDEDIIDVEEVDGVYVPVQESSKQKTSQRQSRQVHYIKVENVKITNNIRTNAQPKQKQYSPVNEFVDGFNEGMNLINTFIKLIR